MAGVLLLRVSLLDALLHLEPRLDRGSTPSLPLLLRRLLARGGLLLLAGVDAVLAVHRPGEALPTGRLPALLVRGPALEHLRWLCLASINGEKPGTGTSALAYAAAELSVLVLLLPLS
jgi:hypothetical protein